MGGDCLITGGVKAMSVRETSQQEASWFRKVPGSRTQLSLRGVSPAVHSPNTSTFV